MHVCVLEVELHLPMAQSLKAKRSIVQSIVRTVDGWTNVGAAEVGSTDKWQRALLGFTVVSGAAQRAGEIADSIERLIWSRSEVEVIGVERTWMVSE